MSTIHAYIWGIRKGFTPNEALFPEPARIANDAALASEYKKVVQQFSEAKDSLFRLCNKTFYVLWADVHHRYYSMVLSDHGDFENRKSYLVFTLVCQRDCLIDGPVLSVLSAIKNLYKEKNSDFKELMNLFTADMVNSKIVGLKARPLQQSSATERNNSVLYYSSEAQLVQCFSSFVGNELYFVPEGSNAPMLEAMKAKGTVRSDEQLDAVVIKHQRDKQDADHFRSLFQQKSAASEHQLVELFSRCSGLLTERERTAFDAWRSELQSARNDKSVVADFLALLDRTNSGSHADISELEHKWGSQRAVLSKNLSVEQKAKFDSLVQAKKDHRAAQLWTLIHAAKSSDWSTDIEQAEPFLDALPQLGPAAKEDYEEWAKRNADRDKYKLEQKINQLHAEIARSGPWARFKNRVQWKRRASQLRADFKDRFPGHHDSALDYINSNRWIPPFIPVSIGLVVVALIGVFIWNPFELKWPGPDGIHNTKADTTLTDADGDGISSDKDNDDSTEWINSLPSTYPLKNYVTEEGLHDPEKIKTLLDSACDLNDPADVAQLKKWCNVSNVYTYKGKKYRLKDEGFYECGSKEAVTDQELIRKILGVKPDSNVVPADGRDESQPIKIARFVTVPDLDGDNDIESYKVPEAVVSDSGVMSKDGSRWRYKNYKWQKLPKNSKNWGDNVGQIDLATLCEQYSWVKNPIKRRKKSADESEINDGASPVTASPVEIDNVNDDFTNYKNADCNTIPIHIKENIARYYKEIDKYDAVRKQKIRKLKEKCE